MRQEESSGRRGKGRLTLMQERADNGPIASSALTERRCADRTRSRERGQALVEFALIAPLFIALVAGVVQFGVALNYWLDLQRLANQGARAAAVNCNPSGVCTKTGATTLEQKLVLDVTAKGNNPTADVCYGDWPLVTTGDPANTAKAGDPVRVRLQTNYDFVPIVKVGTITLTATATMRLESTPTSTALPANDGSNVCTGP
jgi:Flp pilus assembly protein TadG